jgi:hypothetical protein
VELASDPSACSWGRGRIDVFGAAPDGSLLHASWTDGTWSFGG